MVDGKDIWSDALGPGQMVRGPRGRNTSPQPLSLCVLPAILGTYLSDRSSTDSLARTLPVAPYSPDTSAASRRASQGSSRRSKSFTPTCNFIRCFTVYLGYLDDDTTFINLQFLDTHSGSASFGSSKFVYIFPIVTLYERHEVMNIMDVWLVE